MKRLIALALALALAGFMASALFAAPSATRSPAASAPQHDAGAGLPYGAPPRLAPQLSSANFALDWSAVGEISGGASASTHYNLNSTIGQMAANTSSVSTSYDLCTGFECVANALSLYVPLIRR